MVISNDLSPALFWDTNFTKLDPRRDQEYIINRILEHGNLQEVRWMFNQYLQAEIKKVVITTRTLSLKSTYFWKAKLNITEPIKCLQKQYRQEQKKHWRS